MAEVTGFSLRNRNPDVLSCIANLSSDEVFTPPGLANEMLDTVANSWARANDGANIWADKRVTFLDPFTKSGVFLREVVERLTDGLKDEIPDLQQRVDHIISKQVYGIGITHLTSLLARRSVYCSKWANGKHSITTSFNGEDGNIWYQAVEHTWAGGRERVLTADATGKQIEKTLDGRCRFCGVNQKGYDRDSELESHAYAFIHSDNIHSTLGEFFGDDMQFDVIVGNPPYQMKDQGAAASARPIYHLFIQQAISLDPLYLSMVTPSRWFSGGKGLNEFRSAMLADKRLRSIVDFIVEKDAFPNVNINGGVNYFLWDRDNPGDCTITTVASGGERGEPQTRALDEFDIFIRRNEAVPILRKVQSKGEPTFDERVSSRKPFGLATDFHGTSNKSKARPVKLYGSGRISWVNKNQLEVNEEWVDRWKVLVAAASDGNENYPLPIWDQAGPFVAGPGEACSETYLVASLASSREEAERFVAYMRTRFFRFMVSLRKVAQHNKIDNFSYVPDLPMDLVWTDEALFKRYSINDEEVAFIESMIRGMEFVDG